MMHGPSVFLQGDDAPDMIPLARRPEKLRAVLTPEEVARPKYRAALSITYGAGARASEVIALKVSGIDSTRMLITVADGAVRDALVTREIDAALIASEGFGEERILHPTADNVSEPINDFVEIVIEAPAAETP